MKREQADLDAANLGWLKLEFDEHLFIDHLVLYISAKEANTSSMAEHAFDDLIAMFGIDPAFRNRNVFNATYRHAHILKELAEGDPKDNTKKFYEKGVREIIFGEKPIDAYAVLRKYQESFLQKLCVSKETVETGERCLYNLLREKNQDLP